MTSSLDLPNTPRLDRSLRSWMSIEKSRPGPAALCTVQRATQLPLSGSKERLLCPATWCQAPNDIGGAAAVRLSSARSYNTTPTNASRGRDRWVGQA